MWFRLGMGSAAPHTLRDLPTLLHQMATPTATEVEDAGEMLGVPISGRVARLLVRTDLDVQKPAI
jgi:hypothetical protein